MYCLPPQSYSSLFVFSEEDHGAAPHQWAASRAHQHRCATVWRERQPGACGQPLSLHTEPSAQRHSHWKVQALFEEGDKERESERVAQGGIRRLSGVLRRLLGLYIHGKTTAAGVCMGDVDSFETPSEATTRQSARQAETIGLILSPAVRQDLRELCGMDSKRGDLEKRELADQCQAQRTGLRLLFPGLM